MSRLLLLLLVLVPAGYLLLSPASDSKPVPGSYVNESKGFAIKFPNGWDTEVDIVEGTWEISAYDPNLTNDATYYNTVRVIVEELPYKVKSDFFYDMVLQKAGSMYCGFSTEEDFELKVGGRKAYGNIVNYIVDGDPVKAYWYVVTDECNGIMVICMARPNEFNGMRRLFEESVSSFRLI